jgi:hypothetical protein
MPKSTRAYFPTDQVGRHIWAGEHITALEQLASVLDVPAATVKAFRDEHTQLTRLFAWREAAAALGSSYTQALEHACWGGGAGAGVPVRITPLADSALYAPVEGSVEFPSGFYRRIFANIDIMLSHPRCTAAERRQLLITPPERAAPDLLRLSAGVKAEFTGGKVRLRGRRPAPARLWHIMVDRSDGRGRVEAGLVAAARFTDSHELPDRPATWTYTVELRDRDNIAVGRVSVASLSVWKGRAGQGPEGGG